MRNEKDSSLYAVKCIAVLIIFLFFVYITTKGQDELTTEEKTFCESKEGKYLSYESHSCYLKEENNITSKRYHVKKVNGDYVLEK